MAGPQPYAPGQTGTLADVVERGPDLSQFTPAGPDGFAPPPSGMELLHAGRVQSRAYRMDFDEIMLRDGYAPIVDALGLGGSENPAAFDTSDTMPLAGGTSMFGKPSRLATDARRGSNELGGDMRFASRELQEELVVEQIRARRAKDKNFLPGVPDNIEGLHAYFREQEAKKRQAAAGTIARSSGLGSALTVFAGGGIESFHDPINIATLPIGGGGKTLVQTVGREALVNGIIEALQLPTAAKNLDELGEHLTAGEAVSDVATAGVFGGAFGGVLHVAGAHVPPLLFKAMPESVQRRWADRMKVGGGKDAPLLKDVLGDMDNRELAGFAKSTIGERMTPDERAASSVLEREQELGEASPFEHGPVGDGAHNVNLAESLQAIMDGADRPAPARGSLLASSSPIATRSAEPIVVPPGAGFAGQWEAIKGNEHGLGRHGEFLTSPKGAIGPAQVMPGTAPYAAKLAGLPFDEHRYRTDAAYNEALGRAYYAEQLRTFGDPAKAAAAYNAGPGSAAKGTGLRGAMRRAAEHGDPANWEAFLPHETQAYVRDFRRRAGGAAGDGRVELEPAGDDEAGALRAAADQAEQEVIAGSREGELLDADPGGDRARFADVPVLKRELFGNDHDWAEAQAAFHQSLNSDEAPPGAARAGAEVSGAPGRKAAENAPGEAPGPFAGEVADAAGDARVAPGPFDQTAAKAAAKAEHVHIDAHEQNGVIHLNAVERLEGSATGSGASAVRAILAEADRVGLPVTLRASAPADGRPPHKLIDYYRQFGFEQVEPGSTEMSRPAGNGRGGTPQPPDDRRGGIGGRDGSPDRGAGDDMGASGPIDNPELKAFDDGGPGRRELADSLEHDLRMQARAETSRAAAGVLSKLQASGKLPRSPRSLLEFISARGGIEDVNGDLQAMNIERWHRAKPFRRKLLVARPHHAEPGIAYSKKNSPEQLFEAAIDADYFPELNANRLEGGTYEDLLDLHTFYEAIDQELRGRPRYSIDDQEAVFERARRDEGNAELGHHLDSLKEVADEWGVGLDEGSLEHALDEVARGSSPEEALHTAVQAAAMRDLAEAVADTGELRYGVADSGRRWDEEVNYAEQRDPTADGGAPEPGGGRSSAAAADQAAGGAVAGQHEGAAGENAELSERRYQLAPDREPQTLKQILDELDQHRAAIDALRGCAAPGGAA